MPHEFVRSKTSYDIQIKPCIHQTNHGIRSLKKPSQHPDKTLHSSDQPWNSSIPELDGSPIIGAVDFSCRHPIGGEPQ
jgi:hypothetical protein